MAITTTTLMPSQVQQTFIERMLSTPTPNLIHTLPAEKVLMPANGGNTARFSRYSKPDPALVPLGNTGVTPPSTNLDRVDIDVEMQFYGAWYEINEQVVLQNQDKVLTNHAVRAGFQMRETEDSLVRDMMAATAAMIHCLGGTNGDNPTNISSADVSFVVQALLGNDAKTLADNIEGADKFGTGPIRSAYMALAHTSITADLNAVNDFLHASKYPSQASLLPSEWGSIQNLRFFVSSDGSITPNASANGADILNIFCVATEGVMMVEQDRYRSQFIYRPPIYSDPLAQNASIAWKMAFASRIVNDAWVINMRATRNI